MHHERAKKPRLSLLGSRSMRNAPFTLVSVNRMLEISVCPRLTGRDSNKGKYGVVLFIKSFAQRGHTLGDLFLDSWSVGFQSLQAFDQVFGFEIRNVEDEFPLPSLGEECSALFVICDTQDRLVQHQRYQYAVVPVCDYQIGPLDF